MSLVVRLMTEAEARDCIESMHSSVESIRAKAMDLYDREGWRALGYGTWSECIATEFDQSRSYIYRQLAAALIEREVSPIGDTGVIRESQLRPLGQLPPGERKAAWDQAVETTPNGKPTAKHVEAVVAEMTGKSKSAPDDGKPQPAVDYRDDDERDQAEVESQPPEPGPRGEDEDPLDPAAVERRCKRFLKCLDDVDDLTRAVAARVCHGGYDGFPAILTQLGRQDARRVRGKVETLIERLKGWMVSIKEGSR